MRNVVIRALWALLLLVTSPELFYLMTLRRFAKTETYDRSVTKLSKSLLRTMLVIDGCKVRVEGLENIPAKGPLLFVSNHQGHLDSPVLHAYLPVQTAFISIISARRIPIIGYWMECMRCVFMDRDDPRQMARCIVDGVKLLKAGYNVVVFPEGRTANGDSMNEFKQGTFQLALRSGATIVPVSVKGSFRLMDYYGKLTNAAKVTVRVGEPIPTAGYGKAGEAELVSKVEEAVRQGLRLDLPLE